MKKIIYRYSNGTEIEHTKYITKKTILKESNGSKLANIYEKTLMYGTEPIYHYITTISLA